MSTFAELPLDPRLLSAVATLGYTEPTPIQAQAIPPLLAGRDVVGGARTGSGKTAAFGLPLLHRLRDGGREVRGLVLTPTRELALQVRDALADLGSDLRLRVTAIYGGAPYTPQVRALERGVSVVVGTPGRVLDLVRSGHLDLSHVELLVLDEADEMLRMGFIEDVEVIAAATPETRQVALFSATMPDPIRWIAERYLREPAEVQVEETSHVTTHIAQRWMKVPREHKLGALVRLLASEPRGTTLVFVRTRENALEASEALASRGINVEALHGGLSQSARERVLRRVRASGVDVLVATDVAARGLDVDHVTHVVNLDLPDERDVYVHRIGRTGRAGRAGVAVTFVTPSQVYAMRQIARHTGSDVEQVPVPTEHDVVRHTRRRVAEALLAQADDADVRDLLTEIASSTGKSPLDLAVAATTLLLRTRGLSVAAPGGRDRRAERPPVLARREPAPEPGIDAAPPTAAPPIEVVTEPVAEPVAEARPERREARPEGREGRPWKPGAWRKPGKRGADAGPAERRPAPAKSRGPRTVDPRGGGRAPARRTPKGGRER